MVLHDFLIAMRFYLPQKHAYSVSLVFTLIYVVRRGRASSGPVRVGGGERKKSGAQMHPGLTTADSDLDGIILAVHIQLRFRCNLVEDLPGQQHTV